MVRNMDKILSIIVPSYNMEGYLPKCLCSLVVAPDLMEKFEVLVVNDGSKDRTSDIAHKFEAEYPLTFRVVDKNNGNYGSCINAALPLVTGKYVKVLDADDSFATANFALFIKYLSELHEDLDLIVTDYDTIDEDGIVTEQTRFPYPKEEIFGIDQLLSVFTGFIFMHAITYRTKMVLDSGYRQTEGISYTDMEWASLPFAHVNRVSYFPHVIYKYLFGRVGQTVDRAKYVANIWMQGKVALDILESAIYRSLGGNCSARVYIDRLITYILKCFYITILRITNRNVMDKCVQIDKALKEVSEEFYRDTDEWFISRYVRFHYVRLWRSGYSVNTLKFVLFKAYYHLAKCIGALTHK